MSTILLVVHEARVNTQADFGDLSREHFIVSVPTILEAVAYLRIMMADVVIVQIPLLAADFRELIHAFVYGKPIA